jgi:hypothetical protein
VVSFLGYSVPLLLVAILAAPHVLSVRVETSTPTAVASSARGAEAVQPGIVALHRLADASLGSNASGVLVLEAVLLLVLSALLIRAWKTHLGVPIVASVGPVVMVGAYYAAAGAAELGRGEMLAAPLLFACTWLVVPGYASSAGLLAENKPNARLRIAWLASGMAGGLATLFNPALCIVPIVVWAVASRVAQRTAGARLVQVARDRLLPAVFGMISVIGTVVLRLAATGTLDGYVAKAVVGPFGLTSFMQLDPARLVEAGIWFGWSFGGLLVLAFFAGVGWRGMAVERFSLLARAWLFAAAAIVLLQTQAWTRHAVLLLLPPLGLLAIRGLDGIVELLETRLGRARSVAVATAFVLAAVACLPGWWHWAVAVARTPR